MTFGVLNHVHTTFTSNIATTVESPSTRLAKNWKEHHGANNWVGLLNPLDDTLRSELLRYGKFVQAAYKSFDFDSTSVTYSKSRFPENSLLPLSGYPATGYQVTRSLHSSSGIKLPWWVVGQQSSSSWIGYVAVCQDEEEIARLGRRDVVISFRGTATCLEWVENFRTKLTRVTKYVAGADDSGAAAMVESGFWSLYSSVGFVHRSLQQELRDEIRRLLDLYENDKSPLSITFTGHSLGASLAVLAAYDISTTFFQRCSSAHVSVVSFGGPQVGNGRFRRQVEDLGIKILRIVNTRDIVTKLPGLGYSDVGEQLNICCSSKNMADCHDLNVYLQLLKQPCTSSNCRF